MASKALTHEDRTDVCFEERGTILLTEEGKRTEQESEAAPDYHRANFIILRSTSQVIDNVRLFFA
jgi:hypothetical protein